ncbi:cytochrome P450 [Hyunsoonleella sp. SJ7]|uniref:Cytochrome P450 n=1 Tax=Hyunsoonleella aquatilis TaxID=2762758 RepID=A0A923KHL2_9FLAO|nr:cytochrome P450 [Hyunsoonleella aquatilis]MBC3756879.1 cytochrome P450 [Hyunsoonleella aquatilis]
MKYYYPNKISFLKFLLKSTHIAKNPLPYHRKWFDDVGDTFSLKSPFYGHIILTRDAEMAKHILQKNHKVYHKSKIQTRYLSKYVGYGLLTSSGDYWLKQRRLIQPAFHKEKINNLVGIINDAIEEQVASIPSDKMVELYPLMNELAFEVVAKSLFNFSAEKQTLKRLQFIIEKLQLFIIKELRLPYQKVWYVLSGQVRYHMKLVKESRAIILEIIELRRQSKETHDDLLDMLLNAEYEDGSKMTNDQLIDEILILFVAGHETTANALTFTLKLLAVNQKELRQVSDETRAVNQNNVSPLQRLSKLNYTKCSIEESLRLYPPAWITDRMNIQDDNIGSYKLKKGTIIGTSIYELHRNKKYWKQPDQFKPERFFEENRKAILPYYMPFGAGPRLCIGNNFAMYEMMLTLNAILNRFHIETDTDRIETNPLITLKPVNVNLKFTKRRKPEGS